MASGAAEEVEFIPPQEPAPAPTQTPTIIDHEMSSCPICLEEFTPKTKYVRCGCNHKVCLSCTKEYLKHSIQDPHCVHCKRMWDRDFQYKYLGKSFVNGEYSTYRKQLLLDREKIQLPTAIPMLERELKHQSIRDKMRENRALMKELRKQMDHIKIELKRQSIQTNMKENRALMKKLRKQMEQIKIENWKYQRELAMIDNNDNSRKKTPIQYIKQCPVNDCRGYLSTKYVCGLCGVHTCKHCLEPIHEEKRSEHECDPDTVKTVEKLKESCRPCPKCSISISKIYGCDQMWCTNCHTTFSWDTGKIETSQNIHNPHYLLWARQHNKLERNIRDLPCGGLINYVQAGEVLMSVKAHIRKHADIDLNQETFSNCVLAMISAYSGLQQYIIQPITNLIHTNSQLDDLRVQYLRKQINETQWSNTLCKRDKQRTKLQTLQNVFVLLRNVVIDIVNTWTNKLLELRSELSKRKRNKNFKEPILEQITAINLEAMQSYNNIRNYVNKEMRKISKNYNMMTWYIFPFMFTNIDTPGIYKIPLYHRNYPNNNPPVYDESKYDGIIIVKCKYTNKIPVKEPEQFILENHEERIITNNP